VRLPVADRLQLTFKNKQPNKRLLLIKVKFLIKLRFFIVPNSRESVAIIDHNLLEEWGDASNTKSSTITGQERYPSSSTLLQKVKLLIGMLPVVKANRIFLLLLLSYVLLVIVLGSDNPFTYNGGSIMGMAGKECVALVVDKRYASGSQMVVTAPRRVLTLHSNLLVGLVGLDGDVQTVAQELMTHVGSFANRGYWTQLSSRRISPRAMASLTSHILYSSRSYYCEPLLVGLSDLSSENPKPFLCSMDMLGAKMFSSSYACVGAASKSLYGMAEAMWKPDMEPEELVRVCGRAFLSALERDCLSGYGAIIYLITPKDGIIEYDLASRTD
jgi:20S proteasome subunit beta 3